MKKMFLISMMSLFLLLPATLMAMDHSKMDHGSMDHSKMDHDKMDHGKMDHGGMGMKGEMVPLGEEVKDGVKASARIKDIGEAMAKMGMEHTHHLMVGFVSEKNGVALEKGTVAIKVINPDETENKPVKMMGMAGEFGADLSLNQKGMYHFYIGTRLEDGTRRQYHFHTEVK